MKIVRQEVLINEGDFSEREVYVRIHHQLSEAISQVVWPPDSSKFTIYPGRNANGVKPIKHLFFKHLLKCGWEVENRVDLGVTRRPGPIDATLEVGDRLFAVEWETGNISSSHRSLNKMTIGIMHGVLIGGALILPTRKLYKYLTDRIGNYQELEPYFDVWRSARLKSGFLTVIAVEHNTTSKDVPKIPKGTDGWANI